MGIMAHHINSYSSYHPYISFVILKFIYCLCSLSQWLSPQLNQLNSTILITNLKALFTQMQDLIPNTSMQDVSYLKVQMQRLGKD